jgi:hypothetical protein
MKKIMSILTILVVGGLVLSGVGMAGVTTVTYTKTRVDNFPPDIPHMYGPVYGKVGINYEYYIITTDPDGDDVSYYIEWEDGTSTGWTNYYESGLLIGFSHTWNQIDHYTIRAKAKDIYGFISNWFYFPIIMSQSSQQYSSMSSSQKVMSVVPSTDTTMMKNQLIPRLVIYGPQEGYVGVEYIYTFRYYNNFRLTVSEGWEYELYVDWGDGTDTDWDGPYENIMEGINIHHTWYDSGIYTISARVFDGFFSYYDTFVVTIIDNQIPYATIITGPVLVGPEPHEWKFGTIEPDGDNVSYEIFWGDGTNDSWIGPYNPYEEITRSHTYSEKRWFIIRARAKDIHGAIGDWGYFLVRLSKNAQQSSNIQNLPSSQLLFQQML